VITAIVIVLLVLVVVALTTLASAVRVLREYERGVVFRHVIFPQERARRGRPPGHV